MKHAIAWLTALALSTPLPALAGDPSMTSDQENVLTAIQTMTTAFQAGNIDTVMKSYEPGAVVVFEPGSPVDNAEQLAKMFTAATALKPQFTYSGHEVVIKGDTALHIAPWVMTGTAPDGQKIKQSGLSIAVLHRQPDGTWRMVIDNPHGQRLLDTAAR